MRGNYAEKDGAIVAVTTKTYIISPKIDGLHKYLQQIVAQDTDVRVKVRSIYK